MATCVEKLAAAKDVLHALILGESITNSTISGRSTQYVPADEKKLRRYIAELESECGDATKGHAGPVEFFG